MMQAAVEALRDIVDIDLIGRALIGCSFWYWPIGYLLGLIQINRKFGIAMTHFMDDIMRLIFKINRRQYHHKCSLSLDR